MLNLNTMFVIIVVKLLWNHEAQLNESTTNKTILLMQHRLYSYWQRQIGQLDCSITTHCGKNGVKEFCFSENLFQAKGVKRRQNILQYEHVT